MSESLVFDLRVIDRATAPLKAVQDQVAKTSASVNRATSSMRGFAQGSGLANTATQKWAKGALQQAGFQVGDFAVQVANGTNSLQAFGQQAPQLLQIFGPVGAVVGAAVAIIAALGVVAQKSGKDISNLGSALGVLEAPLTSIAQSIKEAGAAIGSVFGSMSGEIDTAIIALGLFGGVMALKAVPALFAATGVTGALTAAMATFKAGLVAARINSIALSSSLVATTTTAGVFSGAIFAASTGLGRFSLLLAAARAAVMTLGAALSALGTLLMRLLPVVLLVGLAKMIELFLRLKEGAGGFGNAMKLLWDLAKSVFAGMGGYAQGFGLIIKAVTASMVGKFVSAFSMIMEKWESLVNGMISSWNGFVNSVGLESLAADSYVSDWAKSAGESVAGWEASSIAAANAAQGAFKNAKTGISDAWNALTNAVAAGTQEVNIFGDASAGAAEKAGGAAKRAAEELTQQQENMKAIASSIRDAFSGAFMSMVDGTKSVKDAFRDMARSIIMKLYEVLVVQRIVNGAMGLVGKVFPSLAPFINTAWNGGGVTGNKPVLVGEKGPEIIVPSRNAQVIPNNQMGGSNVTVNQSISFGAGVTRAEIQAMLPKIVESTKAAVFDAQRRSVNGMGY